MGILFVLILLLPFVLFVPLGLISGFVAWRKGYPPWYWLFSMGPIGIIWILVTRNLSEATTPEEREGWETRANWTGGILSGLTVLPAFAFPFAAGGVFFFAAAPRPARPMMVTPPPAVTVDESIHSPGDPSSGNEPMRDESNVKDGKDETDVKAEAESPAANP